MDKQQRLQEWTARITDFKTSGLTMSAWCQGTWPNDSPIKILAPEIE